MFKFNVNNRYIFSSKIPCFFQASTSMIPVYQDLWLYIQDGEQTMTLRTQVYCIKIPDDKYETLLMAKEREFELISPSGIWEKTTATTGSVSITSANEQGFTITNNSTIEIVPIFTFTPDTLCDSIQLKTSESFGWRIEGTFTALVAVDFNMKTGELTIGGAMVDLANYMTAGSPFSLAQGVNNLYFKASTSGTLSYSFQERYI